MTVERRYTIGVLIGFHVYEGSFPNPFVTPLLGGMRTAARDQDTNLLVGCGLSHDLSARRVYNPAWPEPFPGADFVPVGPWNTDGLLILNPLRFPEQLQYVQQLKEQEFPVLFIGLGGGTPMIVVDNAGGIRQVMEHLVEHGHREIALIAGDETDPGDSQIRLTAYRRAVKELGLAEDPRLVEYGQHWVDGGYHAMQRLMQSDVKFTAVACSNDESAMGAIRAIHEAGLRIPWDIAVTGFDDHLTALAQVPPLTSVHYPLFETGYRSVLLLRKRIAFGPRAIPDQTGVSTWLVPRQSCGCLPEVVDSAVIRRGADFDSDEADSQRFRENLSEAMLEALLAETTPANVRDSRPLCDRLVDSFFFSLADGDLSHFQIALIEVLQRIEAQEDDAHAWQAAISVLRTGAHVILSDSGGGPRADHAEDLLHQARTLISESARRCHARMQFRQTYTEEAMGRMTARLLASLDEEAIFKILSDQLPQVGIRNGRVAFFEPQDGDPFRMSRLRAGGGDSETLRFETRTFPPPGLYPEAEAFHLAIIPLVFKEERMGYAAFDAGNLDPLATVVRQLASVVKSAALHRTVLELTLTDALTGVFNRRYFDILLEKEVNRARRYDRPLALIMIDIDHFKKYNDAFGHPAGDDALRHAAEIIQSGARRGLDVVTRYGGEEFAVILPETDGGGARIVAEVIRESIRSGDDFLRTLTVSLGVSALRGDALTVARLVDRADRALYQAKKQGRNRTVVDEE